MGSTKHEKSFVDFEQPYEQNMIGLKGIIYFGIGLMLLIIVTFGLMWALLNVLKEDSIAENRLVRPPGTVGKGTASTRTASAGGTGIWRRIGKWTRELRVESSAV